MIAIVIAAALMTMAEPNDRPQMIVVVGAAGTSEYGQQFQSWADRWEAAASQAEVGLVRVGSGAEESAPSDHEQLRSAIQEQTGADQGPLWIILIGHGTFDGKQAKFNLRGPDLTAGELAAWLKPVERPLAIINCSSSSGPFINQLSAPGRIVVTATKSGAEQNYSRFGNYLSRAIADPELDLNKDRQTSLLEAFLAASSRTEEFYQAQQRLATEHALIDDNGDSLGTPADWFRGIRATRSAKEGAVVDGSLAARLVLIPSEAEASLTTAQREQRNQLESQLAELRTRKGQLREKAYLEQVEPLLIQLAKIYQAAEDDAEENTEDPAATP